MSGDRLTALTLALALSLGVAVTGCSQERIEEGTGGASSETAGVDAVDATTPVPSQTTTAVPGGQAATASGTASTPGGGTTGGGQLGGAEAPAVGAVDSSAQPRGIEGVGGVAPGTSGVDSSAQASQ